MRKISLNSVKSYLSRDEMRTINGGLNDGTAGYCTVGCNSGVGVPHAPDCEMSTQIDACQNQGGPKICSCLY